ncbi:type VII secretion protein EssA [Enterococcus sp. AZ109]|uniref:type VII secretion protein EssA n=1 Tax=Enterococcus sp. AZ109 TaxID=2774634 RepID=UPI003F25248B
MNKKKYVVVIVIILGLLVGIPQSYAENGKLIINNQVIYEKNEEKEDSIEYQIAPDLFLEKKTQINQEKQQQQEQLAKNIQGQLFSRYQLPDTSSTSFEHTKWLFLGDYQETVVHLTQSNQQNRQLPSWLLRIFAGLIVTGMLIIGVLLGRKFSRVFVKKGGSYVE